MFSRNPAHADQVGIRMGTLDSDPGIRPSARQFVAYAPGLGAGPRRWPAPPSRGPRL